MIDRLSRQAGGLGHLLDRRAAKPVAAEHAHGRVENTILGRHYGEFDKSRRNVKSHAINRSVTGRRVSTTAGGPKRISESAGDGQANRQRLDRMQASVTRLRSRAWPPAEC